MALRDISLRARLIGGPCVAVVLLLGVCVGFMYAFSQQEAVLRAIKDREIGRSEKLGAILARLSDSQRQLSETLAAAIDKKVDEEGIFDRGRKVIDSVRAMSKEFSELRP